MEQKKPVLPQAISVCPACGLFTGPHGNSEECIHALEAEVQQLTDLAERLKTLSSQPRPGLLKQR